MKILPLYAHGDRVGWYADDEPCAYRWYLTCWLAIQWRRITARRP